MTTRITSGQIALISLVPLLIGAGVFGTLSATESNHTASPRLPAGELHSIHCFYGCPGGTPSTNDIIFRHTYTLSSNDDTKFADWVAYTVDAARSSGSHRTSRNFKADPWLDDSETLEPEDFVRANAVLRTDRGHQAPLASFKATSHWDETNYYSNITPQRSSLNQGAWVRLENAERAFVADGERVLYVFTGPLYERPMAVLPEANEHATVPSGYWKIIFVEAEEEIHSAAFMFDQETTINSPVEDHIVTISTIEEAVGLSFLAMLSQSKQEDIRTSDNRMWITTTLLAE